MCANWEGPVERAADIFNSNICDEQFATFLPAIARGRSNFLTSFCVLQAGGTKAVLRSIRPVMVQYCSPELLKSVPHLAAFWLEVKRMSLCRHPNIEAVYGASVTKVTSALSGSSQNKTPVRIRQCHQGCGQMGKGRCLYLFACGA